MKWYVRWIAGVGACISFSGCFNGSMTWKASSSSPAYHLVWGSPLDSSLQLSVAQVFSPDPSIYVYDSNNELYTSGSYSVTIDSYSDPSCTTHLNLSGGGNGPPAAVTSNGVGTFTNLYTTTAATFYLLASADGVTSACSAAITTTAGAAHHLVGKNALGPAFTGANSISTNISAQVVDQYGNPTVPGSAINVTFTQLGSNGIVSPSSAFTDGSGAATVGYTPNASTVETAVIKAVPTGLTSNTPAVIPFQIQPGAVSQFSVSAFPDHIAQYNLGWARVEGKDSFGNRVTSLSGDYILNLGVTGNPIHFDSSTKGILYTPQYFSTTSTQTIQVNGFGGGMSTTVNAPCLTVDDFFVTSGNWSVPANWTPTTPSSVSYAQIGTGLSCTLDVSASVGCLDVYGNFNLSPSLGLTMTGNELYVAPAGSVMDPGSLGVYFSGSQPQTFWSDSNTMQYFGNVQASASTPQTVGNAPAPLLFEGIGFGFEIANFVMTGTYQNFVYIDTYVKIDNNLTIPSGHQLVIYPGGVLDLMAGINIQGKLIIYGSGQIRMGPSATLSVGATGTLQISGQPGPGNLAEITSIYSASPYSFTVSGGTIDAQYFRISGMNTMGLNISGGSSIAKLAHGMFTQIPSGSYAITLGSSLVLTLQYFYDLAFDRSWNGNAINASGATQQIGVVSSFLVNNSGGNSSTNPVYSASYDPSNRLYWEY